MNKRLQQLIKRRVTAAPAPWAFIINGQAGYGRTTYASAWNAYENIKAWAEKAGAEVQLKENGFEKTGKVTNKSLLIEITDPAAHQIEKILEAAQS